MKLYTSNLVHRQGARTCGGYSIITTVGLTATIQSIDVTMTDASHTYTAILEAFGFPPSPSLGPIVDGNHLVLPAGGRYVFGTSSASHPSGPRGTIHYGFGISSSQRNYYQGTFGSYSGGQWWDIPPFITWDIEPWHGPSSDLRIGDNPMIMGTLQVSTVPEPTTLLVWSGLGAIGAVMGYRRKRRAA